jgi:histidinol-phosphate aminotransferase
MPDAPGDAPPEIPAPDALVPDAPAPRTSATGDDLAWLRPSVRDIPAYRGPRTAADFADDATGAPVRLLHLNESPYPPPPRAVAAIRAAAGSVGRYPDIRAARLAAALAARTGVPADRIVLGAGSDELVHLVCEITVGPGDSCVMPWPTFPRYAVTTRIVGGEAVKVPLAAEGANDAGALLAAIDNRTRTLWCCTPNPPSGGMMDAGALRRLALGVPDNVLLAVDEAYHEFGRHAGGPDALAILRERRGPWLVLRTFSKAWGLGGIRVGYALCGSDAVAGALRKTKLQYNVSSLAQAAALAALEDGAYLEDVLDRIAAERTRLADGLRRLGLAPLPSAANFVSAELDRDAFPVMEALAARRILVRDWRDPGHPRHIRITVGTPEDTDAVLDALGDILRDPPPEGSAPL